ncbi:MAG TPA: hypothetical protein VFJ72_11250 [Rubrobacteraceae bacterium]|nr:hypothetical protein [Rubrobacteraceae bacterium]
MHYTTLPMRSWIWKILIISIVVACALAPVACGANQNTSSRDPSGKEGSTLATTVPEDSAGVQEGAGAVAALSGVQKADQAAAEWQSDAELYAIASLKPQVDAEGRAPAWLYTYVSSSRKAVVSVSVSGGKVADTPEQALPDEQIEDISNHTLPPPARLLDSTEAVKKSGKFLDTLKSEPGLDASAGLDSFSTGKPVWIFSTAKGDKRVEERVSATGS